RDGLRDEGWVLWHPIVHRLSPIAVRPTIEAAVTDRSQVIRRCLVAETVAFVDDGPKRAGPGLPCETDSVAQATGKDAAVAARKIKLIDRRTALFDLHAALGDIAE